MKIMRIMKQAMETINQKMINHSKVINLKTIN